MDMHIGAILRSLREEHGLTQSELAHKAGLQQSYLSRLESGTRSSRPDGYALAHIALALGITIEEIFLRAGVWPSEDRRGDLRSKRMDRIFRLLPESRQDEMLAIGQALLSLPLPGEAKAEPEAPLVPRVIGQSEDLETRAGEKAEDRESTPAAKGGA